MSDKEIALELVKLAVDSLKVRTTDKSQPQNETNREAIDILSSMYTEFYNTVSSLKSQSS